MEHNNIYIYHLGAVDSILGKSFLFVFPYTETLTESDMNRFLVQELKKKMGVIISKFKLRNGWIDRRVLCKGFVQHKSKRAILRTFEHYGETIINVHPMHNGPVCWIAGIKNCRLESKMDAMIKLYESIAAEQTVRGAKKRLEARNIIYYDAQKTIGASDFDKRSTEGKAIIQAKRIVQRQKLLAQRGYSISAKRREVKIGMSRLSLHDNLGGSSVCFE
ncbi:hypothetical protein GGH13_003362 [Coemansia sp. S155-1]|nr:hypothetical protein GGH13_003362 [Coemansia sp. S155-1]